MRTNCIVKLSKLQISKLNTLVQKETSSDVEGNLLLRTILLKARERLSAKDLLGNCCLGKALAIFSN
jgi:hypothetical protein